MFIVAAPPPAISSPGHSSPRPQIAVQMCKEDVSQKAADLARAAFPDSMPFDERSDGRTAFIIQNRWKLFDQNHDGRLDFEEYVDGEWAGFLAQLPSGKCIVTKMDFLKRFLGDPNGKLSGWRVPQQVAVVNKLYEGVDRSNKGYITKDEVRYQVRTAFMYADKAGRGYLLPEDLQRKKRISAATAAPASSFRRSPDGR